MSDHPTTATTTAPQGFSHNFVDPLLHTAPQSFSNDIIAQQPTVGTQQVTVDDAPPG